MEKTIISFNYYMHEGNRKKKELYITIRHIVLLKKKNVNSNFKGNIIRKNDSESRT